MAELPEHWPADVLGVAFGEPALRGTTDGPMHIARRVIGWDGVTRDFRVTRVVARLDVVRINDLHPSSLPEVSG